MKNYYRVLGVYRKSTSAQIRSAYLAGMRANHPDTGADPAKAVLLNEAYEAIGTEEARQAYNEKREAWAASVGARVCEHCGGANRITRRPRRAERLVCGDCKAALELSEHTATVLQKQTLVMVADAVMAEVGTAVLERLRAEVLRRIG
ncbi:MAG TPA: DnaJ domain-containing protein [Pseudomonadota bacterium]|jgi:curved DNA-binding protein CbpA|nr:DnaJ domain-containing protein [Pseudomonadota bacterium]